jgi:hypothetical protein
VLPGAGRAAVHPRATARISSFNSVMDLRIIVLLSLQLDLLGLELEGAAFFGAGPFNRGEEVHKQLIGTPKLISHQLSGVPKAMSMILLLRTRFTVRVVLPQQPSPIHVMQRERVLIDI